MKLKWGIWGTGGICNEFAAAMPFVENGELAAVLSRSGEKARSFAQEYGIPSAYGDAQAFLADTDIDVVYIGTPNIAHYQNVMDCLEAGKHVLCEKPMAVNEKELDAMVAAAQARNLFLMEGIWTHFFPVIGKVREWIDAGRIGRPLRTQANFGVCSSGWRMEPGNMGGAMVDLGIYCLTIVSFAFGLEPAVCKSIARVVEGVDLADCVLMQFEEDQLASITCALDAIGDHRALIQGVDGYIEITSDFWRPHHAELFAYRKKEVKYVDSVEVFERPYESTGFQFEAAHVGECILSGQSQSPVIPLEKSKQLIQLMDAFRREWGMDIDTI